MKRKNLEKAIIMSLLAASVSVPVWAEDINYDGFYEGDVYVDVPMKDNEQYIIDTTKKKTTGIGFNGTFDIGDGNLIINAGDNGIASGWMENATLNIYADNIDITAKSNGIFTAIEDGYSGTVVIGSEDRKINSLTINSDQESIDSKNGTVTIYGADDSEIYIHAKGDGSKDRAVISNGYELDGKQYVGNTYIEGGNITLQADNGSGIINKVTDASGTTLVAQGKVDIISNNETGKLTDNAGIKNLAGTTKIDAVNGIFIDSSNNGIYAADGTVTLNGGSINRIDAVSNGIYATGKNTNVTLEAENNGIYVENNDGGATGVHTENGATKDIISEGETEIIVSGTKENILGIHADKNSTVKVDAGALSIDVTAKEDNDVEKLGGIYVGSLDGRYTGTFIADVDNNIDINVTTNKALNNGRYATGIVVNKNSSADLTSSNGDISIKVKDAVDFADKESNKNGIFAEENSITNIEATNGTVFVEVGEEGQYTGNSHAVLAQDADINITAGNNIILNSYSEGLATSLNGGGILAENGKVVINAGGTFSVHSESDLDTVGSVNYGLHGMLVDNNKTGISVTANKVNIESSGYSSNAIRSDNNAGLNIQAGNGGIRAQAKGSEGYAYAIYVDKVEDAKLNTTGNVIIVAENNSESQGAYGIWTNAINDNNKLTIDGASVSITAKNQQGSATGILVQDRYYTNASDEEWPEGYTNQTSIAADKDIIINVSSDKSYSMGADVYNSDLNLTSENGSTVIISNGNDNSYGMRVQSTAAAQGEIAGTSNVNVTSAVNNYVESSGYGVTSWYDNSSVNFTAETGSNIIRATKDGLWNYGEAQITMAADNGINYVEVISADEKNLGIAVLANNGLVDLQGKYNVLNTTYSDKIGFGGGHAIQADTSATVNLNATAGDNILAGVIYAKDDGTNVTLDHNIMDDNGDIVEKGSGSNYIYSSAHGSTDGVSDRSSVVAALYAQNQGKIEVIAGNGGINHIETYYANLDETNDDSERTVWAQRGGIIQIKGTTIIKSSNAEDFYDEEGYATNSRGVAITAGSGEIVADIPDGVRSTVNLEYGPEVKIDGETFKSAIYGDIVAGCGGWINIKKAVNDGQYGIDIQGNVLAANGGELTIDLGQGGTWYGRADDYQDADGGKLSFYNPVFSNQIESSGTVNIIMGEGSKWYLTGQSWVSSLDVTQGKGNVTIDMERFNEGTHGLTISELKGENGNGVDATFVMDLDHNSHSTSDMLYIKNATGEYDVVLNNVIDGMDKISEDNVLRFATVHGGASFNSVTMNDVGLYNLGFEIDHSEYDQTAETENKGYNGFAVDTNKPGNENVEGFFFGQDKDSEDSTQKIMLMDTTDAADNSNSVQNWYITKVTGQDLSDPGKTVVNMSKVNYSNAVYMDRLNKRLGEARYINTEEDQGMWVRMRHDRIGKDNEFRIMNTMYELGYDEKQECDNGERRVGAAIDYMDGSSEYTGVGGSGDVSRKGIWLYDTWLGDKGHYSDFVAKWGHLSNDFTLYRGGDKITGDFSNNVYSISAEYGRKKDIGNNWYFEPQVQLQYARVTDANYTTSQGTEVSLDAINSLIARAGFRLGKDLGERSTVYFKADLLHEFLGDQDIYATDGTGTMDVTYGNEGTWCDIGFGFATAMSKTSYAYLDVETSLGNDYEETYQINAGLQWSF